MSQDRKIELLVSSEMLLYFFAKLLYVSFERSNVVFAILFCFVQNKFVFCKAIVGFYFGIVRDDILAVIVFQKNNTFLIVLYHCR